MENEPVVPGQEPAVEPVVPPVEPIEPPVVSPVEPVEPPPPPKKMAQERIDEMRRKQGDAEREAAYWRKVALGKEQTSPPVNTPQGPQRPTLDQFDTVEEHDDAVYEWRKEKDRKETALLQQKQEQETTLRTFNDRARKLREENDDFDEVIESPVFTPVMRNVLLQSENGPEVAYFLGKPENRDQAEKIRNLPADRQAYEIGKLESNLLLAKKTRKVPGAPAPITPVGMGGGGKEKDPSEMSTTEWMAWDKQRTLEKLKAKYG